MDSDSRTSRQVRMWTAWVFAAGLIFTGLYWTRSQVAGDQLNMLARGWLLVAEGEWVPFGLGTSAGGKAPGGFTSLIVGGPLMVWQHHRAPALVIVLSNLAGYFLLDRIVARELGPIARFLFAVLYWLNPWRLYYSGFLWNPNYLLPLGALHFWTLYRQRQRPEFWASFLQVLALGLAAQLHASVATLVILSLLLWWRGYFRFHWPAVALALVLIAASLVPWALASLQDVNLLPSGASQHGRLLQSLLSVARGVGYWIRYSALIGSSTVLCLDFGFLPRALAGDTLRQGIQVVVGLATLPIAIWANLRLWRGSTGWWRRPAESPVFKTWLQGVVRWGLVGVLLACTITPTAVMSWQLLTVFHLAVMPLVLLGLDLVEEGRWDSVRQGAAVYAVIGIFMIVAIGFGSPMYRCGGETCGAMNATPPPLRANHEMLDALGINDTCRYQVDVPGGWWPDVLPEH